jgi:hypothetical protein
MTSKRDPDGIEAEAMRVRAELRTTGADLRRRLRPEAVASAIKTRAARQADRAAAHLPEAAGILSRKAAGAGLVVLGTAIGTALTQMAKERSRTGQPAGPPSDETAPSPDECASDPAPAPSGSSASTQLKTAGLSALGIGLGYVIGSAIPPTAIEHELFDEPGAALKHQATEFMTAHAAGMKRSLADSFGVSRVAAALLVALALIGDRKSDGRGSR